MRAIGEADVRRARRRIAHALDAGIGHEPLATAINVVIIALILANVVSFVLDSVPWLSARFGLLFSVIEHVSLAVFTIEYALRIWSAVDLPLLRQHAHWRARLRYALRPLQVVDLIAVLPGLVNLVVPLGGDALRVLRLLRLLRLARYSPAVESLARVLSRERGALLGSAVILMIVVVISATLIHLIERDAQPKAFGTIPDAMWWSVVTLATVGYGDLVPLTPLGKVIGAVVIITGLCVFALPIGIVATGFAQEVQRREFAVNWAVFSRVPLFSSLSATAAVQVLNHLRAESYDEGDVIVHQGDPGGAIYFITGGEVVIEVEAGDNIRLGEGELFGEMALLSRRPRSHSVIAAARCRLLVLDREDYERLARRHPEIRQRIEEVARVRMAAQPADPRP